MNLFKIFKEHQLSPEYVKRREMLEKLQGKSSYSEADLKEIFKFTKIPQDPKNPEAYDLTSKAFAESMLNEKIRTLKRLHGVGMIIATAILSFQNPYKYAMLNPTAFSVLRKHYSLPLVHKEHKGEYSLEDYARYMQKVEMLAEEFGMKPFDVEFALSMIKE